MPLVRAALFAASALVVIEPGQEKLLLDMLGGQARIAGCRLENVSVDRSVARARYGCEGEPRALAVELHPTTEPPEGATLTERFAMVAPSAPPAFVAALAERLRAREAEFRWTTLEPSRGRARPGPPSAGGEATGDGRESAPFASMTGQPRPSLPVRLTRFSALLALPLLVLAVRARRLRRRAQGAVHGRGRASG